MASEFKCLSCGQEIIIRFLKPGEEAKCRGCGQLNVVPEGTLTGFPTEQVLEQLPTEVMTKASEADLLEQVVAEVDGRNYRETSASEAWQMFLITLGWFVAARIQIHFLLNKNYDIDFLGLATIIIVVVVHELGHFLAMENLDYQDVRIYFIPLFGAATTGTNPPFDSTKRAIVLLAGPVPGILIGVACLVYSGYTGDTTPASMGKTFLVINALNLLPVSPLDGGRLFDEFFFASRPLGVVISKVVAGIALIVISVTHNAPMLALLSIFPFLVMKPSYRSANLARSIRMKFPRTGTTAGPIPRSCLEYAVPMIAPNCPDENTKAVTIASEISEAWLVAQSRPSTARVKSALMAAQVLILGVAFWAFVKAEKPAGIVSSSNEETSPVVTRNKIPSSEWKVTHEEARPEPLAPDRYLVKLRYPFQTNVDLNGVFVEFSYEGRKDTLLLTTILGLLPTDECLQLMRPGLPKTKITEDGWLFSIKHNFAIIRKEDADRLPVTRRPRYDSNCVALKVSPINPQIGDTLFCAGKYTDSPRQTLAGVVLPMAYCSYGEVDERVVRFSKADRYGTLGLPILNQQNELVGLHNLIAFRTFPLNILSRLIDLPAKDRLMIRVDRIALEEAVKALDKWAANNDN